MRIQINPRHPEPRKITRAVEEIRRGGVVAYPTDTVYGLGCDIRQKRAVEEIYRLKRIRKEQPLAFVCADLSMITRYAIVNDSSYRLIKELTPGPYCFILPATPDVPRVLMMKRRQVGLRIPAHPVAQALIRELGGPIVSTSASLDGETFVDPADIAIAFPGLACVLDADLGKTEPSTVIDLTSDVPVVQRRGAGPVEAVA